MSHIENYCIESFIINGHRNISAKHKTTLEFTKEDFLTTKGDCIIGVSSTKSLADFDPCFKDLVKKKNTIIYTIILTPSGVYDVIKSYGDPRLTYSDKNRIIIRKSNYIAGNTAGIKADKAAADIDRGLIEYLRKDHSKALVIMIAISEDFWRPPLPPYFPEDTAYFT